MKLEPVAWVLYWQEGDMCRVTTSAADAKEWQHDAYLGARLNAFISPLYAIPPGYKLVPVEATPEMTFAGYDACQRVSTVQVGLATLSAIYKAMIEGEQ